MKHNTICHYFISKEELYINMKERVEDIISIAIQKKGHALIALSGGNTPKPFFELLSKTDLAWENVYITLVDERWVDTKDSNSNEYLIRNFLMQNKAIKAKFIGLKNDEETAIKGLAYCKQILKIHDDDFDLVILGMGEDGHTASFFPHAQELSLALLSTEDCVALTPPKAPYERMTLTLSRLFRSENIFLHIEGKKKLEVLNEAFKEGSVEQMPIRAFINKDQKPYLEVFHA